MPIPLWGATMVYEEWIPEALKTEEQWVCWRTDSRNGTFTKVPVDATSGGFAQVDTPETWTDFDTSLTYYTMTEPVDGIGFVFYEDGNYAGVDLDDCRDPETGEGAAWALDVIERLDSYTERSPSGTGYHVLVAGEVPSGGNRDGGLEMYDSHRYFTVTGDHLAGTPPTIEHRTDELQTIHEEYIAEDDESSGSEAARGAVSVPDDELIETAMTAANSDTFRALWNGDTSGYRSHSEADQALCTLLAFWTGGDPQKIEDLFSQSGLVRDKWRDRPDYRERTINTAIQYCNDFYEPANDD